MDFSLAPQQRGRNFLQHKRALRQAQGDIVVII